jgi:nucleotide-binding universal stress UspA family protein
MYRSILVPLDGSPHAEFALPHALGVADADTTLHLVLVHQSLELWDAMMPARYEDRWSEQLRERENAYLQSSAERLRAAGVARLETALEEGPVAATLAHYARQHDIELIAMTTHAVGGIERAWLGSVTDRVIREGAAPVLVVRPSDAQPGALRAAPPPRTLLVAWDGAAGSQLALEHATRLAQAGGGRIIVAHVVAPYSGPTSTFLPHAAELDREILVERRAAADRELADVTAALAADSSVAAHAMVSVHGNTARGILELASEHRADLIVVGTHGRSGIGRTVLGSVADKVIRGATLPVLVCRQPRA